MSIDRRAPSPPMTLMSKTLGAAGVLLMFLIARPVVAQFGSGVIFESSWDTAVGLATPAVSDGGRWPNYWEFNGGTSVQLLSVVSGGVNGHNALRVQQRGSTFAANVQVDNFIPQSTDYYLRYYMKNDDTSFAGDHIVTVDTYNYSNLTFMRKVR